jgi:hypothetical protein
VAQDDDQRSFLDFILNVLERRGFLVPVSIGKVFDGNSFRHGGVF